MTARQPLPDYLLPASSPLRPLLGPDRLDDATLVLEPRREWELRDEVSRLVWAYFKQPPEFLLLRIVMALQRDMAASEPELFVVLSDPPLHDGLPASINRAYLDLSAHAEELYRRKELDPFRSLLVIAGTAALERRTELLKEEG